MSKINVEPINVSIDNISLQSIHSTKIINNTVSSYDNDIPDYNTIPGYSNTNFSDYDNIYINKLKDIMVELQNKLNKENPNYYLIYTKYIEGLSLGDLYNDDKTLALLTDINKIEQIIKDNNLDIDANIAYNEINQILKDSTYTRGNISNDLLNSKILEVCATDNGYDAFVLENIDGNYMIINSSTNGKSVDDILAIAYPMSNYILGNDDLLKYFADNLIINLGTENPSIASIVKLLRTDPEYYKNVYYNQLEDNINLIKKYADKAKENNSKIELYGYSLGGGIQETAYVSIKQNNPEIENYINSLTVYNPYTLFCQEYNNQAIDTLVGNDKVIIYALEEDFVSTFNDSVEPLLQNTVYLNGDPVERGSIEGFGDFYGLIIGGKGNHGFKNIQQEYFDETSGNLISEGTFVNINQTLTVSGDLNNPLPQKVEYKPNYINIVNNMLNIADIKTTLTDTLNKVPLLNKDNVSKSIDNMFNNVSMYIGNNFGNFNYDDTIHFVVDELWKVVDTNTNDSTGIKAIFFLTSVNEDNFKNILNQILTDDEMKTKVMDYIGLVIDKNDSAAKKQLDIILNDVINSYTIRTNNDLAKDTLNNAERIIDEGHSFMDAAKNSDTPAMVNHSLTSFGITFDTTLDLVGQTTNEATNFIDERITEGGAKLGNWLDDSLDNAGDALKDKCGSNFATNGVDYALDGLGWITDKISTGGSWAVGKTINWGGNAVDSTLDKLGDAGDFILDKGGDLIDFLF